MINAVESYPYDERMHQRSDISTAEDGHTASDEKPMES